MGLFEVGYGFVGAFVSTVYGYWELVNFTKRLRLGCYS